MSIQEIKKELGFDNLPMFRQLDQNRVEQPWLYHWDNERRISVTMHESIFEIIKQNPNVENLDYKTQHVEANTHRRAYTRYVVILANKPQNNSHRSDNPDEGYRPSYEKYNGYNGWDDDAIDNAFGGDPQATWNVD